MELLMRCGCVVPYTETPLCAVHRESQVTRAIGVPAPRICGVATGPHVTTQDLAPFTGRLAGSEKTDA